MEHKEHFMSSGMDPIDRFIDFLNGPGSACNCEGDWWQSVPARGPSKRTVSYWIDAVNFEICFL